ncbi:MAG TPA: hypothetical protein V6D20_09715 [Candidatus Obscuribacterales bacterium]
MGILRAIALPGSSANLIMGLGQGGSKDLDPDKLKKVCLWSRSYQVRQRGAQLSTEITLIRYGVKSDRRFCRHLAW